MRNFQTSAPSQKRPSVRLVPSGRRMTADACKSLYGFTYLPVALKLVSKKPNLSTAWFAINDALKAVRHVMMVAKVLTRYLAEWLRCSFMIMSISPS